jgi:hypothetical protein
MELEVPEVSWFGVIRTGGFIYAILAVAITVIMIISTFSTCSKVHIGVSIGLGMSISILPSAIYALSTKYEFIRQPFVNVLKMMGLSEERGTTFSTIYILLLTLLPLIVYAVHSAEDSACVASADEMTSFKEKMMKELQEKQEAEEKNEKKK